MDAWDPQQYECFKAERSQPFYDLLALVAPAPGGRALDLGCGTGALTAELPARLGTAEVIGVDNSPAMLAEAGRRAGAGLRFVEGDLARFTPDGPVEVIIANASLHWAPRHDEVLARWTSFLVPGGQLAVQVPANADHPAHRLAAEVAAEPPFAAALGGAPPPDPVAANVLAPERYAVLLHALGYDELHVRLQVYPHLLPAAEDVVEWVKGSSLTRFREHLAPADYAAFVARYRARVVAALGAARPYLYTFKRVLLRARKKGSAR